MLNLLKARQWQNRSQTTRRRFLITGSSVGISLLAGCSEETDTGDSEYKRNENEDSDIDTNQADETDNHEYDQTNDSSSTEENRAMTVEKSSFEVVSKNSGTGEQSAIIDANGKTIHIEGVITGRNSCYTADLRDVTSEGEDLRIHVESSDASNEGEVCTGALVDIEYTAEITLSDVPATTIVEHNGDEIVRE